MSGIDGAVAASGTFAIGGTTPVHRMGLGAMRLTGPKVWGEPDDPDNVRAVLKRAVALGIDLIDTAEAYGPEVNERQIADALMPYAPNLVIATKCGLERYWPEGGRYPLSRMKGSPAAIRASIEGSLQRLKLDTIILYQLHRIDPEVPLEDTIGALDDLRREGKILHIGLSEIDIDQLAAARAVAPIATVQNVYNLFERIHDPVLKACEAAGIGFMPWWPLSGGPAKLAEHPDIAATAAKHDVPVSQIGLAWLLAVSPAMLLIPGTSSIKHLEQNVGAGLVRLDAEDMALLAKVEKPVS